MAVWSSTVTNSKATSGAPIPIEYKRERGRERERERKRERDREREEIHSTVSMTDTTNVPAFGCAAVNVKWYTFLPFTSWTIPPV